jgi:hypothetical protein
MLKWLSAQPDGDAAATPAPPAPQPTPAAPSAPASSTPHEAVVDISSVLAGGETLDTAVATAEAAPMATPQPTAPMPEMTPAPQPVSAAPAMPAIPAIPNMPPVAAPMPMPTPAPMTPPATPAAVTTPLTPENTRVISEAIQQNSVDPQDFTRNIPSPAPMPATVSSMGNSYNLNMVAPDTSAQALPNIAGDIKKLLTDRWISYAGSQITKIDADLRDIDRKIAAAEDQQRQLAETLDQMSAQREALMNQRTGWNQKLDEATTTSEKILRDLADIS